MKSKLTFIIPTYNRVRFLEKGLYRLVSEIKVHQLEHDVEIIIGNNCSIDDTAEFLDEWENKNSKLNIEIHHHKSNLGVIKNLIYLIEQVKGDFWMFYGDDDFIPKGVLPDLMEHLDRHSYYPIHIFNQTKLKPITREGPISIEECASRYFYYMGNACTVAKTSLSQNVIKKFSNEINETCWPQTAIYFFILLDYGKIPIISPLIIFQEQQKNYNNIPNSFYLFDSAYASLIFLATKIESNFPKVEFDWFLTGIVKNKSYFKNFIIKRVLLHYFLTDSKTQQKSFKNILYKLLSTKKLKVICTVIKIKFLLLLLNRKLFSFHFLFFKTVASSNVIFDFIDEYKLNKQIFYNVIEQHEKSKNQLHSHQINAGEW